MALRIVRAILGLAVSTMAMLLCACATQAPAPRADGAPAASGPDLACTLPSNCVNSLDTGGFKDRVDFSVDPQAQRIDLRSRSLFGLFDWGKNRSRMQEFTTRFERQRGL